MNTTQRSLPQRADVVIVGGGIVGCSIAYHLTKIGVTNVVVLERKAAHIGHHMACSRSGRAIARHAQLDRIGQVHRRAV